MRIICFLTSATLSFTKLNVAEVRKKHLQTPSWCLRVKV